MLPRARASRTNSPARWTIPGMDLCVTLLSAPRSHLRTEDYEALYTKSRSRLHGRSDVPTERWQRVQRVCLRAGMISEAPAASSSWSPSRGLFLMVHGQFCLPQQLQFIATPGIRSVSLALQPPWLQPGNFQPGTGLPGGPRQYLGDPAYQPPRDDPLVSLLYRIPPSPPSSSIWLIKRKPCLDPGQLMLCGQ